MLGGAAVAGDSGYTPIDFAALAAALLDRAESLVAQWIPDGKQEGHEFVGPRTSKGGLGDSLKVNLRTGAWAYFAGTAADAGGDLISLYAFLNNLNNGQAARELMRELGWERPSASSSRPRGAGDARPEPPPIDGPPALQRQRQKGESKWRAVVPVPAHAPPPTFVFGYRDEKRGGAWVELTATRTWEYRYSGVLFGHVARFERVSSDGEIVKDTVARTWCEDISDGHGTQRWHWKAWEAPRPLYVPATLLSADARLVPVVIVEGEKCAEAGHVLIGHEFDFVSWPGGAKAWAKADWSWLQGRVVYLWPDCDAKRVALTRAEREAGTDAAAKPLLAEVKQPGMQAMVNIGSLLMAAQGCTVLMCKLPAPGAVADGWDIADAIAQGWDAAQVRAFIRQATAFEPPDDAARARAASTSTPSRAGAGHGSGDDAAADAGPDVRWRDGLLKTAQGSIKPVRENAAMALDGWPEKGIPGIVAAAGLIAFNEFTNNVEKTRATPWGTPAGIWLESDELLMGQWLVREHWLPSMSRATLEEAVLMVAQQHCFHPVRQRMEARRGLWDGTPRLKGWLQRCCLVEDEYDPRDPLQRYLARLGKWFVMGMVARVLPTVRDGTRIVRGPGTKFDTMLILEGPQSWGKSTLAALLGGEHFADTGLLIGDKDSYQNIQGVLVYEWGELENLSRQEVTKVKLFISSPKDRFRASFDKRPRDYPRQVVFVGTTNESTYLTDVTGNRRFWPVRITRPPDLEWLRANLEQLLSEALVCLDAGERFWPTREEQRLLFDPQQQARTMESSLESGMRSYLYDDDQAVRMGRRNGALVNEIGMQELLDNVGYTIDKQTDAIVKKASALLHSLGWEVGRRSKRDEAGKRPRMYVRPAPPTGDEASASEASSASRPPQGDDGTGTDDDCPF